MELDEEKISRPSSRFVQENSGKSHTRARQSARREQGYSDLNWGICADGCSAWNAARAMPKKRFATGLERSEWMTRQKECINTRQAKDESALNRLQADR